MLINVQQRNVSCNKNAQLFSLCSLALLLARSLDLVVQYVVLFGERLPPELRKLFHFYVCVDILQYRVDIRGFQKDNCVCHINFANLKGKFYQQEALSLFFSYSFHIKLSKLAYLGAYGTHMFALWVWVGDGTFFSCSITLNVQLSVP